MFACTFGLMQPAFLTRLQDQIFDLYQRLDPRTFDPATPVSIVDIDDQSIAKLGQWPWPRTQIAGVIERLRKAKAAAIVFDVVFSEADRTSPEAFIAGLPDSARKATIQSALNGVESNDSVLASAIGAAPVVLGLVLTQDADLPSFAAPYGIASTGDPPNAFIPHFSGVVLPIVSLAEHAAGLGALNWLPDGDQIVRRVPLLLGVADRLVPSLAMESIRVAQGASTFVVKTSQVSDDSVVRGVQTIHVGAVTTATSAAGDIRPWFTLHRPERFVPAWKILDGSADIANIEGRIVLVGSSSTGLTDIRATPVDPAMPGVEVQAQALESLLTQTQLARSNGVGPELAVGVALALGLAALLPLVPALVGATVTAGCVGATIAASWAAFVHWRLLLDPTMPSLIPIVAYVGGMSALFRAEQRDRRFVQDAFGRFVSPDVVASLARNPGQLELGGQLRPLTVMFTDVRDFSSFAERMNPQNLTRFMNGYLSPMSEIILAHSGTVDKYIGDAIMAFWNAPLPDADHAEHAARAALAMLAALPALRKELAADVGADLSPLRCGIGLASGPCIVGHLGSRLRFDYSALGDDVNLASRLEGLTKVYGVDILGTEALWRATSDLAWLEVDTVVVKGREASTTIATLVGDESIANSQAFRAFRARHDAMLTAYRERRFLVVEAAIVGLRSSAPQGFTKLYDLYAERCRGQLAEPTMKWDGVTRMAHK